MIPVCRPRLPRAEKLLPYLDRVDASRYYTNHGQLVEELQSRLRARFGVAEEGVVLASNGTAGLAGAILAMAGRAVEGRNLCVCPAFTFVATGIAAVSCGYDPYIVDVDPESWALDPDEVRQLPDLDRVGVVIPVAPMGRRPDLDAWSAFHAETGIPVVMDAAACFDTLDHAQLARCSFPVVVSLHATKTFSTAEGGLVLCGDAQLAPPIARALNFGFYGTRESIGPSTNGKLSEYHAAVGLADLDGWDDKRLGFVTTARTYRAAAAARGISDFIVADEAHATPYVHCLAPSAEAAGRIVTRLAEAGFESRRWYLDGLHRQPAFAACRTGSTAVTDDLAPRAIGLLSAVDLAAETIGKVVDIVADGL